MITINKIEDPIILNLIIAAQQSTCHRSRCGSIIIKDDNIIGIGSNSMPCNETGDCFKDTLPKNFKSDKTCCVHAEERAIIDALKNHGDKIIGSTLYFLRIDDKGNPKFSGDPYCSICSKLALDVGISEFCLYREYGWYRYPTKEYNELTFKYNPGIRLCRQ